MAAKKKSKKVARSTGKSVAARDTRGGVRRAARKVAQKQKQRPALAEVTAGDPRLQFVRLVSKIGTAEAQRLLDAVVDVETPLRSRR